MTKPMVRIHNLETDEIIDREMTDAEYVDYQAQQALAIEEQEAKAQSEADKAALLERMGLTEEEARLLLS
jgi:hypothetical protein